MCGNALDHFGGIAVGHHNLLYHFSLLSLELQARVGYAASFVTFGRFVREAIQNVVKSPDDNLANLICHFDVAIRGFGAVVVDVFARTVVTKPLLPHFFLNAILEDNGRLTIDYL